MGRTPVTISVLRSVLRSLFETRLVSSKTWKHCILILLKYRNKKRQEESAQRVASPDLNLGVLLIFIRLALPTNHMRSSNTTAILIFEGSS